MEKRIGDAVVGLLPGDTVTVEYRQLRVDGGEPDVKRTMTETAHVRSNTISDHTPGGGKLVMETSGRSDSVKLEVWSDGGVRATRSRHGREETGRLLKWHSEPVGGSEVSYPEAGC